MAIEEIEEQPPIFTEEAEAELSDKMKKLLLEVIDKGRINLEHGTDILSEAIGRPSIYTKPKPIDNCIHTVCSGCNSVCHGCNTICSGCNNVAGCACTKQ
jgi:hypothetical protein